MSTPYAYIERAYGKKYVPGQRVRHTVTKGLGAVRKPDGSTLHYVSVRFDGQRHALPCHPDELVVLDAAQPKDNPHAQQ